jgi:hypothetical protein
MLKEIVPGTLLRVTSPYIKGFSESNNTITKDTICVVVDEIKESLNLAELVLLTSDNVFVKWQRSSKQFLLKAILERHEIL